MNIKKTFYPIIAALLIIGTSNCALFKKSAGDGSVTLKYKFNPGQEIVIDNDVKSTFNSEQMGQEISVGINSNTVLGFKILSVDDGGMKLEMEFVEMSQEMDSPMGSSETDFSKLVGKKASFTMGGIGETTDMTGFDKLPEITSATGEIIKGEMYEMVVDQTFFKLPDHPVKLGDSWTDADTLDVPVSGGNLKTESKSTYLVTEKLVVDGMDCLRLDITGTSKSSGEFEQNGMQLAMERNATSTGNVIFAIKEGMFISMEMNSKTEGIIDVPAAGMEIPQTIIADTKTKVTFK